MDNKIKKAYDSVRISDNSRQKVLEALVAQERKETVITMTSTDKSFARKTAKRSAGMIAAICAAAVMTITAGAYAYDKLFHKEGVAEYIGEETANMIEEHGHSIGQVAENEHFRMTLDAIISNGRTAQIFMTVDALDSETKEMLGKKSPIVRLRYADSDKTLQIVQMELIDEPKDGSFTFELFELANEVDFSRKLIIDLIDPNADFASLDIEEIPEEFFRGFEGLSFEADLSQNYEVAEMHSENGGTLYLSPVFVDIIHPGEAPCLENGADLTEEAPFIYLIKNDGSREKVYLYTKYDIFGEKVYHGVIGDINEYSGVEVDGVLYTR